MNYLVSSITLLLVTVLFVRTVLPRSPALMTLAKEIDPKTAEFRLTVLSMNSSDYAKKGGGLAVRMPIREIRRFFKNTEKRLKAGGRLESFERIIYENRECVFRAVALVEKQSPMFFSLPHCGKYPRVYELCSLLIRANHGYVDEEALKAAIKIFDKHSPLLYRETRALKPMLAFCAVEQLAALCVRSNAVAKITARAEYDAERERIDLTSLKRNAYVYHYCERVDGSISRRFSAVCAENGIDVKSRCKDFERECAGFAGTAFSAVQTLNESQEWLTEMLCNRLYVGYNAFAAAYGRDFDGLTEKQKSERLSAFSARCRRKKTNEITAVKRIDRSEARGESKKTFSFSTIVGLLLFAAAVASVLPTLLFALLLPVSSLPCALLTLPIFFYAALTAMRLSPAVSNSKAKSETKNAAAQAEFAAEYLQSRIPKARDKTQAGSIIVAVNNVVSVIAPICSVALILLAPFYSALWLLAAFSRELVCFFFELLFAFTGEEAVFSRLAEAVLSAFELPSRAVKNTACLLDKKLPKRVYAAIQPICAAILLILNIFAGGGVVFYALAAAFAAVPPVSYAARKVMRRMSAPHLSQVLPKINDKKTFDNCGIYPSLRFLFGASYTATVTDRGDVYDFFDGRALFDKMRLSIVTKSGESALETVLPFVSYAGKTVNSALLDNRRFTVETTACGNGKIILVRAEDGGDFVVACAHTLKDEYERIGEKCELSNCECLTVGQCAEGPPVIVCAAAKKGGEFSLSKREGKPSALTVKTSSSNGVATLVFCAGYDAEQVIKSASSSFKNGYFLRAQAQAAALSGFEKPPLDMGSVASFLLYGRSRYADARLGKVIDLRLNTLLCYQRSGGSLSRLHKKLKALSELKSTGFRFNVAVLCFGGNDGEKVTRNKINLMFDELSLDSRGRAVCIDCGANEAIYEQLKYAAPDIDALRFAARTPNPKLKSCKRASGKLVCPEAVKVGENYSLTKEGEIITDGFGSCADVENRLSCNGLSSVMRADGGGYTFAKNPWTRKLTQEAGPLDSVLTEFVAFSEAGRLWSATPLPLGVKGELYCRIGDTFTEHVCVTNGVNIVQRAYISEKAAAKIWSVKLENIKKSARTIFVTACIRPTLGESYETTRSCLQLSDTERGVTASNTLTGMTVHLETDAEVFGRSLALESILGESGHICRLNDIKSEGATPALIICALVKLPPLSEKRVRFSLSEKGNTDFDIEEEKRQATPFRFGTGRQSVDAFINALPQRAYNAAFSPPVLRRGEKAEGEHYASPLIKGASLLYSEPELYRRIIIDACAKRFFNGDIILFRRGDGAKRASAHSAALFLPMAVARYIDFTDDRDILFERVSYAKAAGENARSETRASVLEHCVRAIEACRGESVSDCFEIDADLLLLYALKVFLPLIKDQYVKLELSDEKRAAEKRVQALEWETAALESLCWSVFCGTDKRETAALILRRLNEKSDFDAMQKLWACAALALRGEADAAWEIFTSWCSFKCNDAPVLYDSDESLSLACVIAAEIFFGCKIKGDSLVLSPCLPQSVKKAEVKYERDEVCFEAEIDNTSKGNWQISSDGISYNRNFVSISKKSDGKKSILKRR